MRTRFRPLHLAAALLALAAPLALAQQADAPALSFSGYGTAGIVGTDNRHADYLVDAFQPDGPGHTRRWSPEVDSRLGLQMTATLSPRVSAVVQVITQQRHDDTWKPVVEWANVKWQVTPDVSVRAGRVVLPTYFLTESRRIGYANPWVRPPVEVYSLVPVTTMDGVDGSWRLDWGPLATTLQLNYGRADADFPNSSGFDAGKAEARDILAGNVAFEAGAFSGRVSYGEARLTIAAYDPLFDAFRQFGPTGEALAARYGVRDRRVSFVGLAGTYDPGPWFATGEWASFDTRSIVGKRTAWYASAGARIGKLTPYAMVASVKPESPTSDAGLPLAFLPAPVQPLAAMANEALNRQLGATPRQRTLSVGMRWDFLRNAALKLQLDHIELGAGSAGTFGNVQPEFERGGRVRVYSAAVDFVF